MQLIVSPDARDGSLLIHQDAYLYQLWLDTGQFASHSLEPGRTIYLHVVSGAISIDGEQ